jgi:hypothetical protein
VREVIVALNHAKSLIIVESARRDSKSKASTVFVLDGEASGVVLRKFWKTHLECYAPE